jgi:hypothetical protein
VRKGEDKAKRKEIGVGEKKVFGTFSALASSSHQKKGMACPRILWRGKKKVYMLHYDRANGQNVTKP